MASPPRFWWRGHSSWAALSAWGQALRRAEKTCLAEVTRPFLTFGPGRPGCPVFPLKPWKKKREAARALAPSRGHFPCLRPQAKEIRPIQNHTMVLGGSGVELPHPPRQTPHLLSFGTSPLSAPSCSSTYRGSHESRGASGTRVPLGKRPGAYETGCPLIHHCLPSLLPLPGYPRMEGMSREAEGRI